NLMQSEPDAVRNVPEARAKSRCVPPKVTTSFRGGHGRGFLDLLRRERPMFNAAWNGHDVRHRQGGGAASNHPDEVGAMLSSTPSFPRSGRTTTRAAGAYGKFCELRFIEIRKRSCGRRRSRAVRHQRDIARFAASLAIASIAARSAGKSAAIQAASAARMAAPARGPP